VCVAILRDASLRDAPQDEAQKNLSPPLSTGLIIIPPCSIEGAVDRGVRRRSRVRCPTTTSRWSAGRRRAPRKSPRAPGPPPPSRLGSRNLGAMTPASPAGEGSCASSLAPPGAPSPRQRGDGKRDTGRPGRPNLQARDSGALAKGDRLSSRTVQHHPSPFSGRVAEAEAIAERGRVGTESAEQPTPPGRSLTLASTLPPPGRDKRSAPQGCDSQELTRFVTPSDALVPSRTPALE
jgi:hypothetical protein